MELDLNDLVSAEINVENEEVCIEYGKRWILSFQNGLYEINGAYKYYVSFSAGIDSLEDVYKRFNTFRKKRQISIEDFHRNQVELLKEEFSSYMS